MKDETQKIYILRKCVLSIVQYIEKYVHFLPDFWLKRVHTTEDIFLQVCKFKNTKKWMNKDRKIDEYSNY